MRIRIIITALVAFVMLIPRYTFATTGSAGVEKTDIIRLNDDFYLETVIEDEDCVTNKTIQDNTNRSKVSKKRKQNQKPHTVEIHLEM